MRFDEILKQSLKYEREILFEYTNGQIIQKTIGTHKSVTVDFDNTPSPTALIGHTHINDVQPGVDDIVNTVWQYIKYGIKTHLVITPTYIFEIGLESELINLTNKGSYDWFDSFVLAVHKIMDMYELTKNKKQYLIRLYSIGISVSQSRHHDLR